VAENQASAARETVAALVQAARSFVKDGAGHPRRAETFEAFATRATTYGERWGELTLDVEPPASLAVPGLGSVHEDADLPLAAALVAAGVRKLTLGQGVAREELQTLTEVISRAGSGDEDLVCALWRAGLWAVNVEAEDASDQIDEAALAAAAATHERLREARVRARTPGSTEDLNAAQPPIGREWAIEAPPPPPSTLEESKTQLAVDDLGVRALEVTRAALWRADAPIAPETASRLYVEVVKKALYAGDLDTVARLLERCDPPEAPGVAIKAAERTVSTLGRDLVRLVPQLYAQRAPQGEDAALAVALRCLEHLDAKGVEAAAFAYPDVPPSSRRPLRRLLTGRGAEALDAIIRLADHKTLEVAKDGLGMLALIPLEGARKALKRFVDDPTTPRDRLDLARNALAHAQAVAPKANKASLSQQLVQNLRDPSREKRLAAARSLSKLGPDPQTFAAVDGLVGLPGFPSADEEEQKALIDALAAAGPQQAIKTLDGLAQRTVGLPTNRLARAAIDGIRKAGSVKK
jgi:hypothetical protein